MKKKILMFALVFLTTFSGAVTINAEESGLIGLSKEMPTMSNGDKISTRSVSMPSKSNLYTNGKQYTINGSAENDELYTNYCFHNVTSIYRSIKNNSSTTLKVQVYYYTSLGNVRWGESISIPSGYTYSGTFSDLDSSKYYFLCFYAPCTFSGYVIGQN